MRFISIFARISLLLIFLVILAGSVVRVSGSGMGCPDWPKCFGQWIPPTEVSALPADYEAHFLELRKEKLEKYIGLIEFIGLNDTAEALRQDERLLESEPFDALGTWIEYVNRLFGFLAGNAMLVLFLLCLWRIRQAPGLFLMGLIGLIALVFQAWLGSVVVATNLTPWTITIHMVVAFFIIAVLISMDRRARRGLDSAEAVVIKARSWLGLAIVGTLVQVILGTQVRQEIDVLADGILARGEWIEQLSATFYIHRSFSILLVMLNLVFLWKSRFHHTRWHRAVGFLLFAEIAIGIILAYADMPPFAQPTHLVLSTLLFAAQWRVWSGMRQKRALA